MNETTNTSATNNFHIGGDGRVAWVRYTVSAGISIMYAYLVHRNAWVEMYLDCATGNTKDFAAMEAALTSARVEPIN